MPSKCTENRIALDGHNSGWPTYVPTYVCTYAHTHIHIYTYVRTHYLCLAVRERLKHVILAGAVGVSHVMETVRINMAGDDVRKSKKT